MSGKIEYAYDLAVVSAPIIKEFYIASGTAIEQGEVVKLVEGAVVAVGDTDQDDPYLGVAAEAHTGVSDIMNPRANGNKIKVYCSPLAVFKCQPGILSTADSGDATTWVDGEIVAAAGFADNDWNGGYLKVKSTAALTNGLNKAYRVSDFAVATGTFTGVFTGGVTAGDTALLFPPVGSKGWDLNSDGTMLDLKAKGGESIIIVENDLDNEWVYFMFRLHQFGNYMVAI